MGKIEGNNQFNQRTFWGLIAITLWSTSFAVTRTLSEQVGIFTSASYSYIISGIIGISYILSDSKRRSNLTSLPFGYMLICGSLFIFYNIVIYIAVGIAQNRLQVLGITLINYLWPSLILILTVIILKRKALIMTLFIGITISLCGAYLAVVHDTQASLSFFISEIRSNFVPYTLALGAAISWGLYSVLNKLWKEKLNIIDGQLIVAPVFLISGILMFFAKLFFKEEATWSLRALIELFYFALLPLLLAYILWTVATQRGNILFLGIISMFLPLLAMLTSCLYLQIMPGLTLWSSCCLTILGAAICTYAVKEKQVSKLKI